MTPGVRQAQIIAHLTESRATISTGEIREVLGLPKHTQNTVLNDLHHLEACGRVKRTHGPYRCRAYWRVRDRAPKWPVSKAVWLAALRRLALRYLQAQHEAVRTPRLIRELGISSRRAGILLRALEASGDVIRIQDHPRAPAYWVAA